jgi:hypothetical protein
MYIAQQKLKENIAEYILYMWQIEDIIRAFNFDLEAIEYNFIRENVSNEKQVQELKIWYQDLINKMKSQKIINSGHLIELNEILAELYFLHTTLLRPNGDATYRQYYEEASPFISEFKERSNSKSLNDIELCLSGLYAKLLLRLKKEKISPETEEVFESFRKLIAYLTVQYHKMKRGELNFHYN